MTEEQLKEIANAKFYDYTLDHPFEFGEDLIEVVRLKRFKGKHLKRLDINNMDMNESLKAIQMSAGWTPPHTDELDACDIMGIMEVISTFLSPSQ